MEFNKILMYIGVFLLGGSITAIFGFWKGIILTVALDLIFLAIEFDILDKIEELGIKSKRSSLLGTNGKEKQ
jgi:hypothetical protein